MAGPFTFMWTVTMSGIQVEGGERWFVFTAGNSRIYPNTSTTNSLSAGLTNSLQDEASHPGDPYHCPVWSACVFFIVRSSLTKTIIANRSRTPITAFNNKSSSCPITDLIVDVVDTVAGLLCLLFSAASAAGCLMDLRWTPMRRAQKDIDGLPPSSDDVAQTIVDHSASQ